MTAVAAPVSAAEDVAHKQLSFGVKMAKRGLWSEALFRFRQADKLKPNNAHILNNLAVSMEAVGLFDEALDAYQRGLKAEPGNPDLRQNYARFVEFYQSFKGSDATDAAKMAPASSPDAEGATADEANEETVAESEGDPPAMAGDDEPENDGSDGSRP
jgi:Flp pilus assembly protein TadD